MGLGMDRSSRTALQISVIKMKMLIKNTIILTDLNSGSTLGTVMTPRDLLSWTVSVPARHVCERILRMRMLKIGRRIIYVVLRFCVFRQGFKFAARNLRAPVLLRTKSSRERIKNKHKKGLLLLFSFVRGFHHALPISLNM
jgi:hypothetical protein